MKRRALHIFVLLLLGAIVNIAMAWGCGEFMKHSTKDVLPAERDKQFWHEMWPERFDPFVHTTYEDGFGVHYENIGCTIGRSTVQDAGATKRLQMGFPAISLEGSICIITLPPNKASVNVHRLTKLRIPAIKRGWTSQYRLSRRGGFRALPIGPVWPGFAINTIFYAAILWLMFFAPGTIRRTIRRRRGLCPACAYDLRGSASSQNCPECGAALPRVTPRDTITS